MTTAIELDTLRVFVPGNSKTKGSMNHIGHGQMVQSVNGSTTWARLMAEAIRRAWAGRPPLTGPLFFAATFVLAGDPIATRAGDGDKLDRNVWDALHACAPKCAVGCRKHAGVIVDDVQFVQWCGTKRQSQGVADPIGVHVMVGRVT